MENRQRLPGEQTEMTHQHKLVVFDVRLNTHIEGGCNVLVNQTNLFIKLSSANYIGYSLQLTEIFKYII